MALAGDLDVLLGKVFLPADGGGMVGGDGTGRIQYGFVVRGNDRLDEALLVRLGGRPDRAELHCHGGSTAVRNVVMRLAELGVKEVEPEYFNKVASCGRMPSRLETEARKALMSAGTRHAARVLAYQWRGALGRELAVIADGLRRCSTEIGQKQPEIIDLRKSVEKLLRTAPFGISLCSPRTVAIVGRVNVGKSTLLNALLGWERIIVHHEPGTTRDIIEELLDVEGIPLRLMDTAGIRHTDHRAEAEGVRRSRRVIANCDLALVVLDASIPLTNDDLEILCSCRRGRAIILLNKCDLSRVICQGSASQAGSASLHPDYPVIEISAKIGFGLDVLRAELVRRFDYPPSREDPSLPVVFIPEVADLLDKTQSELERRLTSDHVIIDTDSCALTNLSDQLDAWIRTE